MAVDVGISHMTLLIVTLAFSLVNICLIIATGGIIYNWQDRFMGPVLKCDQPKWTSDGKDGNNVRTGWAYQQNNNVNYNNGNGNAYGNANVNAGSWGASVNVNGNNNANVYTSQAVTYGVAASGVIGSSSWSSVKDNSWSTCPFIQYPRWSTWTQPTTAWVAQPTVWNTWTQPTAWVSWTQPTAWVAQPTAWVAQPTVWVAAPTVWVAQPTSWVAVPSTWASWGSPSVVISGGSWSGK